MNNVVVVMSIVYESLLLTCKSRRDSYPIPRGCPFPLYVLSLSMDPSLTSTPPEAIQGVSLVSGTSYHFTLLSFNLISIEFWSTSRSTAHTSDYSLKAC